ncbi:MAG: uroporphyrinogen-III synthase [Actinomycetota bacterium]|nr:uroporphyrinogen-III synthase [Actinomycetota bacterium]
MPAQVNLDGCTVGITADRRGEDQAVMWRRLGAKAIYGPALGTIETPDVDELRARTAAFIDAPPDFLVANTGLGIRRWLELAETWGCDEPLRAALGRVRVAARGPKAAGALRRAGIAVWWRAPDEQLSSVAAELRTAGVSGLQVAVQLHGEDHPAVVDDLRAAGATVVELPVYRWILPGDRHPVEALITACCAGQVDALTFTAGPAVRNLVALADESGRAAELLAVANRQMVVGCVGPVCGGVATEEGFNSLTIPEHWRLGAMVTAVAAALSERPALTR